MTVSAAQKQFANGPVGIWYSYLGGGADMLIGMQLSFQEDGSGKMQEWGFDHHHLDPEYVTVPDFQWKSVGDCKIEITYRGETRTVQYEFKNSKNEYEIPELRIFETGLAADEHGDTGFWLSPYSLVYRKPEKRSFAALMRLFSVRRVTQ